MAEHIVIGHFDHPEITQHAIRELKGKGHEKITLYSPMPNHHLDDELYEGKERSPVRMFTLFGAITGLLGAFLMTSWMSTDYALRTSAKSLISIPAFVVVAFECTILLGAISTLIGMFHHSRIPNLFRNPGYRPEFSEGTFGLVVRVPKEQVEGLRSLILGLGAKVVEDEYVR